MYVHISIKNLLVLLDVFILRCDMELAAAITAGALGIIVLLFGGYVFPLVASSSLNCYLFMVQKKFEN